MRSGDTFTPVLIELIEAWCLKEAKTRLSDACGARCTKVLADDRVFEDVRNAVSQEAQLCIRLVDEHADHEKAGCCLL